MNEARHSPWGRKRRLCNGNLCLQQLALTEKLGHSVCVASVLVGMPRAHLLWRAGRRPELRRRPEPAAARLPPLPRRPALGWATATRWQRGHRGRRRARQRRGRRPGKRHAALGRAEMGAASWTRSETASICQSPSNLQTQKCHAPAGSSDGPACHWQCRLAIGKSHRSGTIPARGRRAPADRKHLSPNRRPIHPNP
jgi:hypothetical protein